MGSILIDLFSDTQSDISAEMRSFMCAAEVGNEVAGEDPTVNKLLEEVCGLLGKEAALFLPTGTMCNVISFRIFCPRPGDAVILHKTAHPFVKAHSIFAGIVNATPIPLDGNAGQFSEQDLRNTLQDGPKGYNIPRITLLSIEQATNFGGGTIWPLERLNSICHLAKKHRISTHMDGARLLNAVSATQISARDYVKNFDAVWLDFSKSLGAPMGAVLAGSKDFIDEAWYHKFQLGGALHKVGVMAAACLFGLKHNLPRLNKLQTLAKLLATRLSELPWIDINMETVETNVVIWSLSHPRVSAPIACEKLLAEGIRVLAMDHKRLRAITHLDTTEEHIKRVVDVMENILVSA